MIKIGIVKKKEIPEWEKFVENSNNGTIFHFLKFQKYHRKGQYKFINLTLKKDNKLVAVISGSVVDNEFISPMGASYGSFVTGNIGLIQYEEIIDSFLDFAKKKKFNKVTLTLTPFIYFKTQNEIEKFLLEYKKFTIQKNLITNALSLQNLKYKRDVLDFFTVMHRRAVLKSFKKEISVIEDNNFTEFYKILLVNKKKFNTMPTHSLEELRKLKKIFPRKIKLFMAYDKDKIPLGGILLVLCNKTTALAFYICHDNSYQEYRVVNRLFYEIVNWSKKNHYKFLDLGVSMDTSSKNPMEPSRSLIFFKEGIGSRGFVRTTYSITL